ncbi:hypothetical protein XELAEV_18003450mg [Xenopus laevis]|nr:hypothetical protein XELAEV_18003450mg [Xenopus laevis]
MFYIPRPSPQNYKYLLDFLYYINEFNNNPLLSQNLTLGYHIYDSCGDVYKAQRSILQILSGLKDPIPNYSCAGKRNIVGFIGDLTSITTIPIAHILSVLGYSQISYGATDPFLSDRATFPFFFRTVQGEESQYFAITQLLKYFGWTWVGIITSDDISGDISGELINCLQSICIDFTIKIHYEDFHKHYPLCKEIIQRSSTSIVIFCGTISMETAENLRELSDILSEKTFIFPSSWLYYSHALGFALALFNGSLVVMQNLADYNKNDHSFRQFLDSFHPSRYPDDKLLEDIWMRYLYCQSQSKTKNFLHELIYSKQLQKCTGEE